MKKSIRRPWFTGIALSLAVVLLGSATCHAQAEAPLEAKWYLSGSLGYLQFEGDEEVKDAALGSLRLGYDYSEWWGFEGAFFIAPSLDQNTRGVTRQIDGEWVTRQEPISDSEPSWGMGIAIDGLFHFTRWERLDPYLTIGGGVTWYDDEVNGEDFDPAIRVGAGVMYHFNDMWAMRLDGRTFLAGNDTEANAIVDAGVVWTWGAVVPPIIEVVSADDPDRDGLPTPQEEQIGTDPYDPDTDKDGLKDGEEVNTYQTDPLNPDTDWDGLKDGPEVHDYRTDPTKRDTDAGGVADGHEVIEDGTNPLDPSDDLLLFELYIQFDKDKSVIKPQFFPELDKIGKVLTRNPDATARIEGHADRSKRSVASYNKALSERRARAVMAYLTGRHKIKESRMKALGYGFDRPKEPNDPKLGNPRNRRVEVYLRGVGAEAAAALSDAPPPAPENK